MVFLRDAGYLEVLEESWTRQERWVKRFVVLDKEDKVLRVMDGLGRSSRENELFRLKLGKGTKMALAREFPYHFKVLFEGNKVISFRAEDQKDLDSWFLSLECIGRVCRTENLLDNDGEDCHPQVDDIVVMRNKPKSDSEKMQLAKLSQPEQQHRQQKHHQQNDQRIIVPLETSVRRSCGYLFMFAKEVSEKWRETFCVVVRKHLLEFAFPGDTVPLFIWSLSDAQDIQLEKGRNGRIVIKLKAKLEKLDDDDNVITFEDLDSNLYFDLHLCGKSSNETYNWASSLPDLIRGFPVKQEKVPSPRNWTIAPPLLARECARYALAPFYPHKPLSVKLAHRAAAALSWIAHGELIESPKIRVSTKPRHFHIASLMSDLFSENEDLRLLTFQLLPEDDGGSNKHDLVNLGKHTVTSGKIVDHFELGDQDASYWPKRLHLVEILCKSPGNYRLHVKYDTFHIFGSPFRIKVRVGKVHPPSCTIGGFREITRNGEEEENKPPMYEFCVMRRDPYLNLCQVDKHWKKAFHVTLEGEGQLVKMIDPYAQTMVIQFTSSDLTSVVLHVTLDGQEIRDSPFRPATYKVRKPLRMVDSDNEEDEDEERLEELISRRIDEMQLEKMGLANSVLGK